MLFPFTKFDVYLVQLLRNLLNFEPSSDLGRYIGVKFSQCINSKPDHLDLITKFSKMCPHWIRKSLSFAGRHVLLSSVLNFLPNYFLKPLFFIFQLCWTRLEDLYCGIIHLLKKNSPCKLGVMLTKQRRGRFGAQ